MSFLTSVGEAVRRWVFAPVEPGWSEPQPDHEPYIRASDYGPCCQYHLERSFKVNPESTTLVNEALSGQQMAYILSRLGPSPQR